MINYAIEVNIIDDFSKKILLWFETNGRKDLPWQKKITPYRVWVSEIMLQQTQVATAMPYFSRFIYRFPTLDLLAEASMDEVLELWTGLGYYARGRNLHRAAKIVAAKHGGVLPSSIEKLLELPGIGRSTAGAIISIAHGGRAPILDGNVKRVLTRAHAIKGWPGESSVEAQLWKLAEQYTPNRQTDLYTQAIMDLGATVCTRTKPKCSFCPIEDQCIANLQKTPTAYPEKKPRKALPRKETIFVIMHTADKEFFLQKRPQKGVWGGLWCFPEITSLNMIEKWAHELGFTGVINLNKLPIITHTFSHYKLYIEPVIISCKKTTNLNIKKDNWVWYNKQNPKRIGLPAPIVQLIDLIQ